MAETAEHRADRYEAAIERLEAQLAEWKKCADVVTDKEMEIDSLKARIQTLLADNERLRKACHSVLTSMEPLGDDGWSDAVYCRKTLHNAISYQDIHLTTKGDTQ